MTIKRRIAVPMALDMPYKRHASVFAGIHDYAQERGDWHLIVDDWADRNLPARADKPSPYDGIVGRISALGARRARQLGVPAVNVHFSSPAKDVPGVFPDYAESGRLVAEHLLARGFKHFGVLSHAASLPTQVEGAAFGQAVREAQCDEVSRLTLGARKVTHMGIGECDLSKFEDWRRAMRAIDQWLDSWRLPIGLYIFDVALARVVIEKCAGRGWEVPEDVAIVAGWNEEVQCERPAPGITSVELPNEQVGYEAARLLDRLMNQREDRKGWNPAPVRANPKTILLPPVGIVARESTDYQAVEDDVVRKSFRYMNANLHKQILVDDIAEDAGVSRRTLATRFQQAIGRSIAVELQRLRLERVKRELTGTDQPIYQIAEGAGYGSVRTFNGVFVKAMGCTPGAYRKRGQ